MTAKRKSNFELLRIVSMFFIVAGHLACHGIQHVLSPENSYEIWSASIMANKIFTCILLPGGGGIGVAIFFMISGYFRINQTEYSLKKLVLETVFYGWFSLIVVMLVKLFGYTTDISLGTLLSLLVLPVSTGYWFITVYVLIMLASPVLNEFLRKMNRRGFLLFLGFFWLLWLVFAYFFNIQYADLLRGIFSYSVGAFCRLHLSNDQSKEQVKRNVLLAIVFWLLGAAIFYVTSIANCNVDNMFSGIIIRLGRVAYRSVVSPICAFATFRIFESLDIRQNSGINRVASTTLGVYLISDSVVLRDIIWHGICKVDTLQYGESLFPLYVCITVIVVFAVCSLIDYLRISFIEPVSLKMADNILAKIKQWDRIEM